MMGVVGIHVDKIVSGGSSSVSKMVVDVPNDPKSTKHLADRNGHMSVEYKRYKEMRTIEM